MFLKNIAFSLRISGFRANGSMAFLFQRSFAVPTRGIQTIPAPIVGSRLIASFKPVNGAGNICSSFYTSNNYNNNSSGSGNSHRYRNSYTAYKLYASATAVATLSITSDTFGEATNEHVLTPVEGTETREYGLYLASQRDKDLSVRGLTKKNPSQLYLLYKRVLLTFRDYIYNPIATCFRFVQLVVLFGPVIVSLPMVLFGPITFHDFLSENVGDLVFKSKDRLGAVLWYKYLTWTMELAGPSFIKVCANNKLYYNLSWVSFVVISSYLCAPFILLFSVA